MPQTFVLICLLKLWKLKKLLNDVFLPVPFIPEGRILESYTEGPITESSISVSTCLSSEYDINNSLDEQNHIWMKYPFFIFGLNYYRKGANYFYIQFKKINCHHLLDVFLSVSLPFIPNVIHKLWNMEYKQTGQATETIKIFI